MVSVLDSLKLLAGLILIYLTTRFIKLYIILFEINLYTVHLSFSVKPKMELLRLDYFKF